MKKTILLIVATLFFSNLAFTQSDKKREEKAKKALDERDYSSALAHYDILISKHEGKKKDEVEEEESKKRSSVQNYYRAAESARHTKVYYRAEFYYKRVIEFENYRTLHPMTKFWMGVVQKRQGDYTRAITTFKEFVAEGGFPDPADNKRVDKHIEDCEFGIQLEKDLTPEEKETLVRLRDSVNSIVSDFAPIKTDDMLYFSSLRENYELMDIVEERGSPWVQQVDDRKSQRDKELGVTHIYTQKDEEPFVNMLPQLNEAGKHAAHVAFANDNTRIYYTLCDRKSASEIDCMIYYRDQNSNGTWGEKVILPETINRPGFTTTQPTVGMDKDEEKDVLYFASDRPSGRGGMDIWYCYINSDGTFTEPENLDENFEMKGLNTEEDEVSPFWDATSRTLYFSSEGHKTVGSQDVFMSKKRKGKWSAPENMGMPINSSYDDMYYSISQDGSAAYMTSNRPGGKCSSIKDSLCICNDIYWMATPKVRLEVYTFNAIDSSEMDVNMVELTRKGNNEVKDSQEGGQFFEWTESPLDFNFDYGLLGTKPEYDNGISSFTTRVEGGQKGNLVIIDSLYLMPEMDLITKVYDVSSGEREPLNGATVTLYKKVSAQQKSVVNSQTDASKNAYFDKLTHSETYLVIGSKPGEGYLPDTTEITIEGGLITTEGRTEPTHLFAELELCRELLPEPLPVYFYNAIPRGSSSDLTTSKNYESTYKDYINRYKKDFMAFSRKNGNEAEMIAFFKEVDEGFVELERFTRELYNELDKDNSQQATIIVKAYASRRAADKPTYSNPALTNRRASSLENYILQWPGRNGRSNAKYAGRVLFKKEPFGHSQSCDTDGCDGIYNIQASEDRRVEILRLEYKTRCDGTVYSTAPKEEIEEEAPVYQEDPPKKKNDY